MWIASVFVMAGRPPRDRAAGFSLCGHRSMAFGTVAAGGLAPPHTGVGETATGSIIVFDKRLLNLRDRLMDAAGELASTASLTVQITH